MQDHHGNTGRPLRALDVREVEAFALLARTLHFGLTADRLAITQSAVSQRIARLESALQLRLLTRGSASVQLTQDGAALLPEADRLVAARDAMLDMADALRRNAGRPLRLLVSNAVLPSGFLPVLRDALESALSHGRVVVDVLAADAVAGNLLAGRCDLAVSTLPPPNAAIAELVVRMLPLAVATPAENGQDDVTAAELFRHRLIVVPREDDPAVFDGLVAAAALIGTRLDVAETVVAYPSVLAMVALGRGWGLVPLALAALAPAGVRVRPLLLDPAPAIRLRLQWPSTDMSARTRSLVRRLVRAAKVDQQR